MDEQQITGVVRDMSYVDLVNSVEQAPEVLTGGTRLKFMACQRWQLLLLGANLMYPSFVWRIANIQVLGCLCTGNIQSFKIK